MSTSDNPKRSTTKSTDPVTLEFKVGFEGQPDKAINVIAYAFDRQGQLLGSAPLKQGVAQLSLQPDQARTARIFFAPESSRAKSELPLTVESMERLRAYEVVWEYDPKKSAYELLPIPEFLWKLWPFCLCRVRGQVVKPVNYAGNFVDLPVCNARVHICEVDPIWWLIPRLPEPLILRLRDELLRALERPFPHPIPLPDPPPDLFDLSTVISSPENLARVNRARLLQQQLPSSRIESNPQAGLTELSLGNEVMLNPQPLPPKEYASPIQAVELETQVALTSSSLTLIRQTLQNNIALFRPYLCWWPWIWPWLCRCDEIAVLTTDAQGRFDTTFLYSCTGDHPDLYFWVEYNIGGTWTTVYHPNPVCCHTYWDYVCGSEVVLRVTDPRVIPCGNPPPDLPGLQISILSIGNRSSIHAIPVDSTASAPLSGSANEGLENGIHPFGGQLEPHVEFSRSALIGLGITHYRWSYRQITDGGGNSIADTWHAMDRQVIRHYQVFDAATSTLSYPVYPLGPDPAYPGHNLFQIQPINPPTGHAEDWAPNVDAREDSSSAFFPSHLTRGGDAMQGAGKYELKLELFKPSVSTAPVNLSTIVSGGIAVKVANVDAPFGQGTVTTVNADDQHRFKDGSGNTLAFRLVLHVDNNVCDSAINPLSGMGLAVDADCGFIQYQPNASAHISFRASHPHNFATFQLNTVRGLGTDIPDADATGQVNIPTANGFARVGDTFSKDILVNTLLTVNTPAGHTPCLKAAFSEELDVQAMATDGWQQLSYLDAARKHVACAFEPA